MTKWEYKYEYLGDDIAAPEMIKLNKLGKRSFIIYHTLWGKIKAESFIT